MKSLPGPLAAHVAQGTTSLAWLLLVTRTDAAVYAFTSAAADVTVGGVRYLSAPGLDISSIVLSAGLSVDNLELTTLDDGSTFTRGDVLGGRWRNASFAISRCNYRSVSDGVEPIMAGTIGDVRLHNGYVVAELRGLQQYLQQPIGAVTSKTCRARLGDSACGVNLIPHTLASTITSVTNKQSFVAGGLGGDPNYASSVLILHGDGTHGSTTFTDHSSLAASISIGAGSPIISTAQSKFGGASMSFTAGQRIQTPSSVSNYQFPGDLTMAAWVRSTSTADLQFIVSLGSGADAAIVMQAGRINFWVAGASWIVGLYYSANVWYHVEVTRSAGVWRLFVDGVLQGSYTSAGTIGDGIITVGGRGSGISSVFGFVDDVRVDKGLARHTTTFTPPTAAYPNNANLAVADQFAEGILTFTSGANAGLSQKVKTYGASGDFVLSLPMIMPVQVGDAFSVVAGCSGRLIEDCRDKFGNVLNFQGEPHVPGLDAMTRPAT